MSLLPPLTMEIVSSTDLCIDCVPVCTWSIHSVVYNFPHTHHYFEGQ